MDFIAKNVSWTEAPWCVDGRNDSKAGSKGPQLLGGSILPVVIYCLSNNLVLSEKSFVNAIKEIKSQNVTLGVHRGGHMNPSVGTCDCGFSDRLEKIFETAVNNFESYFRLVEELTGANLSVQMRSEFIEKIKNFKTEIMGEKLVALFEKNGGQVVNMEGDHAEGVCFVNTVEGTTLDLNKLSEMKLQAFNLDLWVVAKYAQSMNIDIEFAKFMSLVLYLATHQVLVVDKGKSPLDVKVI